MPTATGLTVRVINNVVKKMDVKPRFYDAFRKDGYQGTFQFKQKVHSTPVPTCLLCSDIRSVSAATCTVWSNSGEAKVCS